MADLVLVRPGAVSSAESHWSRALPLGLGYLAASARKRGLDIAIVDGKTEGHTSIKQTLGRVQSLNPSIVGISSLTAEYTAARRIAAKLKDGRNPPITVLGGSHANALPAESLEDAAEFDFVIAGEAECSLADLIDSHFSADSFSSIPGLYWRDYAGRVRNATPACYSTNLEALPHPAWDLFPRSSVYPIMWERGCPYNCVFCSRNMSNRVRSRSVEHVMDELHRLYKDFSPREVYFEDETFGLKRDPVYDLLRKLAEFNRDKGIVFKAQTRVDRVNEELAGLMKNAGFKYVEMGVESGDQDVLTLSRKAYEVWRTAEAVKAFKSVGIKVWLNFIIGLPGESRQSVRRSINLASELNPDRLSVAIIVAYPGSDIFEWAVKGVNGYRLLTKDYERFDKYLAGSVELDTLSYGTMRRYQLQMYVETYIRNYRILDLFKLVWGNRSFIKPIFRSHFGRR